MALRVASYNLAGKKASAKTTRWCERVARTLSSWNVDVVGFQEFPARRIAHDLVVQLDSEGFTQADGGEQERVFYRSGKVRAAGHRRVLIDAPGEKGETRYINWSEWRLSEPSVVFNLCNVHLMGSAVKAAAAASIIEHENARRTILVGDFNLTPMESLYARLVRAGWQDPAKIPLNPDAGPTFHGFGKAAKTRRIDWILAPDSWAPLDYRVVRRPWVEDEPSDHYLVLADLVWDGRRELRAQAQGAAQA